ncbi:putative LCCL domain containing protein [Lyophyllum shimeji]|uniref:LCCL domain containing protein n=1 Tax=Lyophyllum shimeji TaxID=47721 RepID=A0A9P3PIG0_LYOSH|nr:putative LCCL domain containing protein [Lyophyllum shimeji]
MAEASPSPSSGSTLRCDSSPFFREGKAKDETTFQLVEVAGDSPLDAATLISPRRSRGSHFFRKFSSKHPRLARILTLTAIYLRGPRPEVDLKEPTPLFDIDWNIRDRRVKLPLESTLLCSTKLTNPWLFLVLGAAYVIGLAFFSRAQSFLTPASSFIGCTSAYWASNNNCGLNGALCEPFSNTTFDFRCPAQCNDVILQNPRTIGNEQVVFKPLIVGGGDAQQTYRGDSFICAAATQAGFINNSKGGCASLELVGNFTDFLATSRNGLTSAGFPTVFPLSFRFRDTTSLAHCEDRRDAALALNIIVTWILFVVLRPKPIVLYWCLVCIGYWHVSLFSQPRSSPPALSLAFGDFLPTLFIAYAFWRLAFRFVMPAFSKAPFEASIWYLAPYWVGVLTNLTTDKIPISRLTASDLSKRSGAITALVVIIVIVAMLVFNQIRVIRKTGWLPHYLKWYILGGLITLVLALLPGLQLRLHHYILAMVLIPGTAFPTRLSAIYQGFLLGMFLNGVAAFGYDSILQTVDELRQDGPQGSLLPTFLTNSTNFNASIPFVNQTISWDGLTGTWDGFALLVDDVERYVGNALNFSLAAFDPTIPHFFRLAFTSGDDTGDFTMPAVLWPNGTWVDPLPGPS